MLDTSEIIVILLSGIIGSLIVLATTFLASKYGSISGVITTIPTNTLVSLLGISINVENTEILQRDIYISIILSYCSFIYLLIFWIYLPKKIDNYKYPITQTCIMGVGTYCLISFLSYEYIINNLNDVLSTENFFTLSILVVFKYYYFASIHKFLYKFENENIKNDNINKREIFLRLISSFIIISLIVFIGKINQIAGVIMSSFPLLSIINSIILWDQTRDAVLISQLNSNILIGGTAIYMYILTYGFFIDKVEIYLNVIISLFISLIVYNYPIYVCLKKINENPKRENRILRITHV